MDGDVVAAIILGIQLFGQPLRYLYEDDELDELLAQVIRDRLRRRNRRRALLPRIEGYVERILPAYSEQRFKEHFRLSRDTFEFVLGLIGNDLVRSVLDGNQMISPEKQLLVAIWRMATPDSYRSITEQFNIGKATAIRSVRRVVRLLSGLASQYIVWPTGNQAVSVAQGFFRSSTFPNVIGAIDGTHINIPAPKVNPEAYVNRKHQHSIQLQAVCDHTKLFTHCYVGNVGSVHDARVFRLSSLSDYMGDPERFPNDSHLVGDAAYPLHSNLMVPYRDNGHLTQRQKKFNFCQSSCRMAIERAFGLLKGRWRSLLNKLAMGRIDLIPHHVMACCVLHNICIMRNDELMAIVINDGEGGGRGGEAGDIDRAVAIAKRDLICAGLQFREV